MVRLDNYISRAGHRTLFTTIGMIRRFKLGLPVDAPLEPKDGDDTVIWGAESISAELNCPGGVQQVYALLAGSKTKDAAAST